MKDFTRGIIFTVGAYMFGKSMYELGQIDERRKHNKVLKRIRDITQECIDILEQRQKEKEES